ncbi:MAG: hypothetical protein ACREMR_07355 [Gemmatimonadales bacterium]
MARQCPRCELRFTTAAEVREHLISDHGMTPEQLAEPYPLPGRTGTRSRVAGRDADESGDESPDEGEDGGARGSAALGDDEGGGAHGSAALGQ